MIHEFIARNPLFQLISSFCVSMNACKDTPIPHPHLYANTDGSFMMSLAHKPIIVVPQNHGNGCPIIFSATIELAYITEVGNTIFMEALFP